MNMRNPKWIDRSMLGYQELEQVPEDVFARIKKQIREKTTDRPLVSVVIPAYNEELNIIRCLDSLAKNKSKYPFEIVVVNNNSKDRTQETLDRLGVTNYFQEIQGPGPARQMGLEKAKGEYILSADADCLYPSTYIETMTDALLEEGVAVVYGNYSFLSESSSRLNFAVYEALRNLMIRVRHIKRPYLNTLGICMGFSRKNALKEGYTFKNTRGEDGRLTFDLMKYGRVKYVKSKKTQVWTGDRTLSSDGSLLKASLRRIIVEVSSFDKYFRKQKPHNTKETLTNEEEFTVEASWDRIKRKVLRRSKK